MFTRSLTLMAVGAMMLPSVALGAEFDAAEMGSMTIDANVSHTITPDSIALNVNCSSTVSLQLPELRKNFQQMISEIRTGVGTNGTVRRNGTASYYPGYDPSGQTLSTPIFSGNFALRIVNIKPEGATAISNLIEDKGCTATWDARIRYSGKYAKELKDELFEQINDKKEFMENLLGKKLTKVSTVTLSTSLDAGYAGSPYGMGYGTTSNYDPDSNTVEAITSLSITYDFGTGVAK